MLKRIYKRLMLLCLLSLWTTGMILAFPTYNVTSASNDVNSASVPTYSMSSVNNNRISAPAQNISKTDMQLPALAISRSNMEDVSDAFFNPNQVTSGPRKAPPGGGGGGSGVLPNPIGDTPWMIMALLALGYIAFVTYRRHKTSRT